MSNNQKGTSLLIICLSLWVVYYANPDKDIVQWVAMLGAGVTSILSIYYLLKG